MAKPRTIAWMEKHYKSSDAQVNVWIWISIAVMAPYYLLNWWLGEVTLYTWSPKVVSLAYVFCAGAAMRALISYWRWKLKFNKAEKVPVRSIYFRVELPEEMKTRNFTRPLNSSISPGVIETLREQIKTLLEVYWIGQHVRKLRTYEYANTHIDSLIEHAAGRGDLGPAANMGAGEGFHPKIKINQGLPGTLELILWFDYYGELTSDGAYVIRKLHAGLEIMLGMTNARVEDGRLIRRSGESIHKE